MKTTSYIQVQNNQGLSFWIETDSLSEPPGKIDQNSSVKEDSNTTQFAEREEPVSSYADREQPVSLSLKRLFTPEIKKVLTLDGFQEKLNSLIKGIANLPNDLPSETKQVEIETGATVNAPLFINEGDYLKIDSRTGDYIERAKV